MNIISVCIAAVFAVLCSAALRNYSGEIASLLLLASVVFIALMTLPYVQSVLAQISGLSDDALIGTSYLQTLIKAVGICWLTHITANICRENGGQSAAAQVELCGRLSILILACPLYADILTLVSGFLG